MFAELAFRMIDHMSSSNMRNVQNVLDELG